MKIIVAVVAIVSLIAAAWAWDEKYISADELKDQMKQERGRVNLKIDMYEHRQLIQEVYRIKGLLRENPGSQDLKDQLEETKKERDDIRNRIDQATEGN